MCVFALLDLRKHDVAFLLTVRPTSPIGTRYNPNQPFVPQVGLVYVRGCEIEGMLDEAGKVIEEGLSYTHARMHAHLCDEHPARDVLDCKFYYLAGTGQYWIVNVLFGRNQNRIVRKLPSNLPY